MNVQNKEPRDNTDDETRAKPSRRAWIMRGLVTPLMGLLAVASIALGIMNATVWKPSTQITADARVKGTRYVVTDPGVLPLVDEQAKTTVTSSDGNAEVCIALGSGKDVNGWVGDDAYTRIVGLSDWSTLDTQKTAAKKAEQQPDQSDPNAAQPDEVAFKDSDMWTTVECGTGKVTLNSKVKNTETMTIIDLGSDSPTADIAIRWDRQTVPDFAMPFYFAGGLLVVMAILTASVFAMPPHKRRKRMVVSEPVAEEVTVSEALAGSLAGFKPAPSRKSKRGRRRHASHRAQGTANTTSTVAEPEQPTIVDPGSRNLVADQALANAAQTSAGTIGALSPEPGAPAEPSPSDADQGDAGRDDATSVITPDELQAYFARLAQESQSDTPTDDTGETSAITNTDTNQEGDQQ